jgi:hypothetical protein
VRHKRSLGLGSHLLAELRSADSAKQRTGDLR